MSWQAQPVHVLDFEGSPRYGVIEYGVVTLQNGEVARCYTALCAAEEDIDERDVWLHGLRRADTDGHPPFREHWDFFNGLRQTGPLAAHHAQVEHSLLKRSWPYPTAAPDFSRADCEVTDWGPWLDTRALYQRFHPELPEHKLGALVKRFELQEALDQLAAEHCPPKRSKYHCALYDTLAAALLLLRLGETPALAEASLPQLIAASTGIQPDTQGELF